MKPTENIVGFFSGGDSRGRSESENPSKEPLTAAKPSVGAPKGNHNRLRHGVHAVTRLVNALGTDRALDKRTAIGKALERWRQELIEDLGGRENISAQRLAIIDLAVKNKLILDSIDRWIFSQASLIDKRKRALIPVVLQRQQLANGLAQYLTQLGLERRHKVKSLNEILSNDDTPTNSNGEDAPTVHTENEPRARVRT
jgi:hypothetical protein